MISLHINGFEVRRILIDMGCSADVIFLPAFKHMELKESDLQNIGETLLAFNGAATNWAEGRIELPVKAGPITVDVDFLVIDAFSSYNVILGRNWIHKMIAVPSTYYYRTRFPTPEGLMEIRLLQKRLLQYEPNDDFHQFLPFPMTSFTNKSNFCL